MSNRMSLLLEGVRTQIEQEYQKPAPLWRLIPNMAQTDLEYMQKECSKDSEFDPMNARKTMLHRFETGKALCEVRECDYGKVIVIYDGEEQKKDLPWGLWGRILRRYTEKGSKPFRIFFLASPHVRLFPKRWFREPNIQVGEEIKPQHINGGYTYHCNRETIMIYRAEDATRVLLHELMHSCCLDKMEKGIDQVEAETEAWAELLYIGFLSQGKAPLFRSLHQRQSDWMRVQDHAVKAHIKNPRDFPWRYTMGKEEVWGRWGILLAISDYEKEAQMSLRLTAPPSDTIKRRFHVSPKSTIL